MRQGVIKGGRALASLVIGFAISAFLLFRGWVSVRAFGVPIAPGSSNDGQIRRLLNFNLPIVVRFMLVILVSSGLLGVLVYAAWTIIDRQIRRRKV